MLLLTVLNVTTQRIFFNFNAPISLLTTSEITFCYPLYCELKCIKKSFQFQKLERKLLIVSL